MHIKSKSRGTRIQSAIFTEPVSQPAAAFTDSRKCWNYVGSCTPMSQQGRKNNGGDITTRHTNPGGGNLRLHQKSRQTLQSYLQDKLVCNRNIKQYYRVWKPCQFILKNIRYTFICYCFSFSVINQYTLFQFLALWLTLSCHDFFYSYQLPESNS